MAVETVQGLLPVNGPDEAETPDIKAADLDKFEQESYEIDGSLAATLGFGTNTGTDTSKVHLMLWGVTRYKEVKSDRCRLPSSAFVTAPAFLGLAGTSPARASPP